MRKLTCLGEVNEKLIAMILALVMVLSLVACGNNDTPEQTNGSNENTGVNEQTQPSETEGGNGDPVVSNEITLENLMKAAESPEIDFECVDHGNGDVELLRYLGSSEIVVIPATWNGKEITSIASYVFANQSSVKAIKLSDSIKTIKGGAFGLNASLEIVVCGAGLEEIGEGAFQNCTNLKEIVLNEGLLKLDEYSLSGLKSLVSIELPSSVTEIHNTAFYASAEGFAIIGTAGSYSEEFATSKGITFKAK